MSSTSSFDVIVVGAGAAGCVVASRLAERPSRSVLLLEAGPDLRRIPPAGMHDGWAMFRDHGWGYESTPGDGGTAEPLHRGRLVGGTSWLTRFAVRGSPEDFDAWAAAGNPGWGFTDVLPFFRLLERDLDFGDRPWHGDDGPIPVTRYPDLQPSDYEVALRGAFVANGFDPIEDHNEPGTTGFGRMPRSAHDGVRVTTADTYLAVDATPANLTVRAEAPVAEIVLEGTSAVGVRLIDGSVLHGGWVVLCGGTYGSPILLQRSGVGPAAHLRSVGVTVRVELDGVGANLADHPSPSVDLGYRGAAGPDLHCLATFRSSRSGPEDPPDLAIWSSEPAGDPAESSLEVVLLTPSSRGSVRIRSADPGAPPVIMLPGLRSEDDVDRLCEGMRRGQEIALSPALRAFCADDPTTLPKDDAELRAMVRDTSWSIPHTVGTCAMGPSPDDGAVVDSFGSVHGVDGLSVVDASIMPSAPSGFPHLVTIMIAEKLSQSLSARG